MSQLTLQDIAEVVEEVVERVFDRKLDEKLDSKLDNKLDERFTAFEEKIDRKLDVRFRNFEERTDEQLNRRFIDFEEKIDGKFGFFMEHVDDKFDALAEALQVMSGTISTLARDSDLREVRQDVKTIRAAVRDTNHDLHRLESRFDGFEQRFGRWEQAVIS